MSYADDVQIRDTTKEITVNAVKTASGDVALVVSPIEIPPVGSGALNPRYVFTRDVNGNVTKIQMILGATTYSQDFTRDVNGNVTAIGAWY